MRKRKPFPYVLPESLTLFDAAVRTFNVEGCLSMYTWIALYQNCDLLKSFISLGIGTKATRCPPQCLWMFEKYHRMAYSGRKITFWTPLHSEWYIHGLTSRFFCASTFDLRVHFKGSRRRNKQQIYQPKILYKVIITKDRVNGVCGIACTYIQEAKKVSKFYNITCYCSQIRAFVWSKTNLPKSGRLWTCFSIRYRLIPQKQVFEFWGMSVSFNGRRHSIS